MYPEGDAAVQTVQLCQPFRPGLGCFPVVGGHLEQGVDVRLAFQGDALVHGNDGLVGKALIGCLFLLVGVGAVVQDLFQLPQVIRRRNDIEERSAGAQNPPELLQGQGEKQFSRISRLPSAIGRR